MKPMRWARPGKLIVAGRAVRAELGLGKQRAKFRFDRAFRFGHWEKVGLGQDFSRADRHQLNEPEKKIAFRREIDQRGEPILDCGRASGRS